MTYTATIIDFFSSTIGLSIDESLSSKITMGESLHYVIVIIFTIQHFLPIPLMSRNVEKPEIKA